MSPIRLSDLFKFTLRAVSIRDTLGMRPAAGYLRNRGVPFEQAHLILLGRKPRFA